MVVGFEIDVTSCERWYFANYDDDKSNDTHKTILKRHIINMFWSNDLYIIKNNKKSSKKFERN